MKLSLVIPCFNEEKNLPYLFEKLDKFLLNSNCEVILVNNGSKDNTCELLKKYKKKHINVNCITLEKNIGYGNGIIRGLENATGELLAWTHADMQTDPNDVIKGKTFFKKNKINSFVKGKRNSRPIIDQFFTLGMSIFASLRLKKSLWDINAQPTIFHKSLMEKWQNPPNDFSLDLFAYYHAKKSGYEIYRFPVNFNKRLYGTSHWNFSFSSKIKFIKRTVKFIIKLSK